MNPRLLVLIIVVVMTGAFGADADDRLEQIMLLWPSRDYDTLQLRITEALVEYRESGDSRREAIAYLFLSLIDISKGDQQTTRVHFGEATTRFEAAGDFVDAAFAYWLFAEHERLSERQSDHVLAFYEKAFTMLKQAESQPAAFSIEAVSFVGPVVGFPPDEHERHAATPAIQKATVLQLLDVFVRTGYGAEFLRIGELEKAEAQLLTAKKTAAIFGGRLDPSIDRYIGNLRRRQWQFEEARESYAKALEGLKILRPIGVMTPKRLRVEVFSDLAELEMLQGHTDGALAWNDRALELVRAEKSPETEVKVLTRRAEILARAARFSAAEAVFGEAQVLAEEHDLVYLQITIYLSSASLNRTRGRYGAAAAEVEKALEALAKSNEPFREPAVLSNLAMHYSLLEASDSARIALERARRAAEAQGRCIDVATIDLLEAVRKFGKDELSFADFEKAVEEWLRIPDAKTVPGAEHLAQLMTMMTGFAPADPQRPVRSGMVADGMVELLQAGALFSEGREFGQVRKLAMKALELIANTKHRAAALMMIGGTYLTEGNDEKTIEYFTRALDTLHIATEEARADPFLSDSPGAVEWSPGVFEILLQLLIKHQRHEEAFAVSERVRSRVFLQMLGNSRITPRGPQSTLPAQEAEALRTQMLQWQQQVRLTPGRQIDDDIRHARQRYEALMPRVKAANPEYAAMTSVEPLQLEEIRAALPENTTLVNYFVTASGAHGWVLDRKHLRSVPLPFDPTAAARAACTAKQFHVGGRGVRPNDSSCEAATVEELYVQLFEPLRAHIRNPNLIIVPHGVLHYLPFVAFRDPRTKRYLIEDYTITYAPSASAMRFLREKETAVKGKALVIGAPAGVTPELPGAMREARAVAGKFNSVPMTGTAAKESLLYRLKGEIDLIHIAAHGFYEAETPLFSRLALASGDGMDGNFEVHEILSEVDLRGVNLVVLSACQTAVGKGNAGDEIVGLTRALLYAGTPGVISTLWDIDDDAAAALMNQFYDRLLAGVPAADALRDAQLQLLQNDYSDPGQWAAFTLTGNPEGIWKASTRN